jgi:hypothetical protein
MTQVGAPEPGPDPGAGGGQAGPEQTIDQVANLADLEDNPQESANPDSPDSWSLDQLTEPQDFQKNPGVLTYISSITVGRPNDEDFFRICPDRTYRALLPFLESKKDRKLYLILPPMRAALRGHPKVTRRLLVLGTTLEGQLFLWPLRQPNEDGEIDSWSESAQVAARLAERHWIRMFNPGKGPGTDKGSKFETQIAADDRCMPDPDFHPELSFLQMIRIAFRNQSIGNPDHPILKRLQGRIG